MIDELGACSLSVRCTRGFCLLCWLLPICICISFGLAHSGELPNVGVPASVGINIHQLNNVDKELTMIKNGGFQIVRLDLLWDRIEKNVGSFDFGGYDEIVDKLRKYRLRPLFILAYSNHLYSPNVEVQPAKEERKSKVAAPRTIEARAAFVRFVREAVFRYRGSDVIWEIWNEPDNIGFWAPKPNVEEYISLAIDACQAIRKFDPGALVIAPGAATTPRPLDPRPGFLQSVIASDLSECIDGLSVHPYLSIRMLDWAPVVWQHIRSMIDTSIKAPPRKRLVPVSSEWGLSTYREGITEETQASYIVKMLLLNISESIPISVVYDWKDDGDDPKNPEHRFGIIRRSNEPKPAYFAVQHMTEALSFASYMCRRDFDRSTNLLFLSSDKQLVTWVSWPRPVFGPVFEWEATRNDSIRLNGVPPPISANDLFGHSLSVQSHQDSLTLEGGFQPYYLTFSADRVREFTADCAIPRQGG
jgi:polysaccharide biosynthesis protein PslG